MSNDFNINPSDFQLGFYGGGFGSYNSAPAGSDTIQNVNIVDVICEGPVKGLVGGTAGVFFNDTSVDYAVLKEFIPLSNGNTTGVITFSGGAVGSVSSDTSIPEELVVGAGSTKRQLILINYLEEEVTISGGGGGIYTATSSSGTFTNAWLEGGSGGVVIHKSNADGTGQALTVAPMAVNGNVITFASGHSNNNITIAIGSGWKIRRSKGFFVNAITTSSVTVDTAPSSGTYSFRLQKAPTEEDFADSRFSPNQNKIKNLQIESRLGTLRQTPLAEYQGVGGSTALGGDVSEVTLNPIKFISSTSASTLGVARIDPTGMPIDSTDFNDGATIISSSAFGITSAATMAEVDQIRWAVRYNAFQTINLKNGDKEFANAYYKMQIDFKRSSTTAFENKWVDCFPSEKGHVVHRGNTNAPISFDHVVGLNQFRPFVDFKVRIIRVNRHIGLPIEADGTSAGNTVRDDWQVVSLGQVSQLTSYITDKFSYPNTALVSSTFSSQQFPSIPKRSYLMEGLIVKVPTNYTPREYSSETDSSGNPKAVYDGFWDGGFQYKYTDNPAWVFYDIITNKRYGAGRWVSEEEIDKYALYRIARYCDDLVDDGKGGVEPRFRANVFLTKATDVYKVIKDMATIFLGILYWQEGKLTPVQDAPQDPIYTFTKANVIDGKFNYESTGSRTRINQVVVTWNDPSINYEPVPIVVEDREEITRTGKIISQNSVAFGATSEGQAIRYGRWKLWTALNQTEVVTFSTALEGAYIRPGDVVTIQDADKYGKQLGGRISSYTPAVSGTSAGYVTVDRQVQFNSGSTYTLNTIVTAPTAFWTGEDSITINSVTIPSGGRVKQAYVPGYGLTTLDTEQKASNAFLESSFNTPLGLVWKPHTYLQQTEVTNNSGTDTNIITVQGGFGEADADFEVAPTAGTVWSLVETVTDATVFDQENSSINVLGSGKQYKILSVTQEDTNIHAITAVEHYNSKYAQVESGFEVADTITEILGTENIPPVRNLRVALDSNAIDPGEELILEWDAPDPTEDNANLVTSYIVKHNVPEVSSPIQTTATSLRFTGVPNGIFDVSVVAVTNKSNKSLPENLRYYVIDPYDTNITRVQEGIPKGIFSQSTIIINQDDKVQFEFSPNAVVSIGDSLADTRDLDTDDNLSVLNLKTDADVDYNIFLDNSGISLFYYDNDSVENIPFWRQMPLVSDGQGGSIPGNRTAVQTTVWTSIDSTVSVEADSNIVTGISNTSGIKPRDLVIFESIPDPYNATPVVVKGAFVVAVESSTTIRLDRTFETALTNVNLYRRAYRPDFSADAMFARVSYLSSSSSYSITKHIILDPSLDTGKIVFVAPNVPSLAYTGQGTQVSNPNNISIAATALGFKDPVFKVSNLSSGFLPTYSISSIDGDASTITVQTTVAHNLISGYEIKILGTSNYNGTYTVAGITNSTTFTISSASHNFDAETSVGKVAVISSTTTSISSIDGDTTTITVDTSTAHNLTQGDLVSIVGTTNYNGNFVVATVTDSDTFTIASESHDFNAETSVGTVSLRLGALDGAFQEPDIAGGFLYTKVIDSDGDVTFGTGAAETITVEVAERYNETDSVEGIGTIIKVTEGSDGVNGNTVFLTAEDFTILYDETGANPSYNKNIGTDSTITFTASANNFTDPRYKFTATFGTGATTGDFTKTGFDSFQQDNTATLTIPTSFTSWADGVDKRQNYVTIKVEAAESSDTATVLSFDEVAVQAINGNSGYWTSFSNEAHTISTDSRGVPLGTITTINSVDHATAVGSGTTIEVGKGGTILTYVPPYQAGVNPGPGLGQYTIIYSDADSVEPLDSIDIGTLDATNTSLVSFGDHKFSTEWDDDVAQITYTLLLETAQETDPNAVTITRTQSFSKSKKGFGGISITNENPVQALAADKNGEVLDYSNSGTEINVLLSGESIPYYKNDTDAATAQVTTYWKIEGGEGAETVSPASSITIGSLTTTTNGQFGPLIYGNHSAMSNSEAKSIITYPLSVIVDGVEELFNVTQTITKNTNASAIAINSTATHVNFNNDGTGADPSTYTLEWEAVVPAAVATAEYKLYTSASSANLLSTDTATSYGPVTPTTSNLPITYIVELYKDDNTVAGNLLATDKITINKSLDGAPGLDGADGAAGSAGLDAKAVKLTAGTIIFDYNSSGSSPSPTSTTVTANPFNLSGTGYYEFFLNNTSTGSSSTTNTYTYTPQSSISNMPDQIEVEMRDGSATADIIARDQISMGGIKPGADGADGLNGSDGVDAITTFYSNQAHTVPVSNTGAETWTGSGGILNIFSGTTELVLNSNTQTASYPSTNNRYNLNITKVSGDTLTEPAITGQGSVGATLGDFAGDLTQATQYKVSIYARISSTVVYNPTFLISLSPSFEGADGATGPTGSPGSSGADGNRGAGRWYIDVDGVNYAASGNTNEGIPATSDGAQEAWDEGVFFGGSPGTEVEGDQAWFFKGTVSAPTDQGVWIYNGTSWTEQTEFIDGNLLVAGTITADRLVIGSTNVGASTSTIKVYDDVIRIFEGGSLRVVLGNLNSTEPN